MRKKLTPEQRAEREARARGRVIRRARATTEVVGETTGADRVPERLRWTRSEPLVKVPEPRDRSLRGKRRRDARKAARR